MDTEIHYYPKWDLVLDLVAPLLVQRLRGRILSVSGAVGAMVADMAVTRIGRAKAHKHYYVCYHCPQCTCY
jgi:hypothetical protein